MDEIPSFFAFRLATLEIHHGGVQYYCSSNEQRITWIGYFITGNHLLRSEVLPNPTEKFNNTGTIYVDELKTIFAVITDRNSGADKFPIRASRSQTQPLGQSCHTYSQQVTDTLGEYKIFGSLWVESDLSRKRWEWEWNHLRFSIFCVSQWICTTTTHWYYCYPMLPPTLQFRHTQTGRIPIIVGLVQLWNSLCSLLAFISSGKGCCQVLLPLAIQNTF